MSEPFGVAADAAGNVYVSDWPAGTVSKGTIANGTYTYSVIVPNGTISEPLGLTLDGSGNVYVADGRGQAIYKVALVNGKYATTKLVSGTGFLGDVKVDPSGNLFYTQSNGIYELVNSNGSYSSPVPIATSGFNFLFGLTLDSSGNIYATDYNGSAAYKETKNGSSYVQTKLPITGLNEPEGIAIDASGNLYFNNTGSGTLLMATATGNGSYAVSSLASRSGEGFVFTDPLGRLLAVNDGSKNIFVDTLMQSLVFGSTPVGMPATQISATFTIDTAGTLGTPTVLTQGAPGLDFTLGTGGTCTGAVPAGQTCVVNLAFTPKAPGLRTGAVSLTNASGAVIATALISGVGTGPEVAFLSPQGKVVQGVPAAPRAIAIDGLGNIYDPNSTKTLYKINAGGATSAFYTSSNNSSVFAAAAVDGAGNVYLVDRGTGNMVEVSAAGALLKTVALGSSSSSSLGQIALDASGTAYIANAADGTVIEVTQAGTVTSQALAGNAGGTGVAVDSNGTLYVTVASTNQIAKIVKGVQTNITPTGAALNGPNSLAVDAGGNLYVTNGSNGIVFVSAGGVGTTMDTTGLSTGFLYGIALDGAGNLYFADQYNGAVSIANLGQSRTQALGSPAVGTSSNASITIANIGNTTLSFPPPGSGGNPSFSAGLQLAQNSTCPQVSSASSAGSLAAGTSCLEAVTYTAASTASYSGSVVLTDNNLNASPSTSQAVTFSGSGTPGVATVSVSSLSTYPTSSVPVSVTVSYGGVQPTGAVLLAIGSTNVPVTCTASSYTETCNGTVNASTLAAGTYPLTAQLASDANYAAATGSGTVTVVASTYAAGTEPVGVASGTQTATILLTQSGTVTGAVGLTQGATGTASDFQVSKFSCSGTTAGSTCAVQYTFKPSVPGVRQGGIQITDVNGKLLGSTYLSGAGTGAVAAFYPGTQTQIVSNIPGDAFGIATDGNKNLYFSRAGTIFKSTFVNGTYSGPVAFGSGMNNPSGVAVDGQGNIWIADSSNGRVLEEVVTGTSVTQTIVFSGLNAPFAVAVDASGNVYIGAQDQLLRETYTGTGYTQTVLDSGFGNIISLAVDATGALYLADAGQSSLYKEVFANGTYTRATIAGALVNVNGVAVDAAGDVYAVADGSSNQVLRWAPDGNGGYKGLSGLGSFARSNGVTVDGGGNLYVTDDGNGESVYQIKVSAPLPLTFAPTAVGASSAAQITQVSNIGNAFLSVGLMASQADFTVDAATTTCGSTLVAGATCSAGVRFTPQSINASAGQLIVASSATSVPLSGTAKQGVVAVVVQNSTAVLGSNVTLSATLSYGGIQPTGAVSFAIGAGSPVTAACTASAGSEVCTASLPTAGLTAGTNSFGLTLASDSNYASYNGSGSLTLVPGSFTAPTTSVSTSAGAQATLVFSAPGTLGSINVLTQGAPNLDFTLAATGSTCVVGQTYSVGDTCTVQYTFSPKAPGERLGGITLADSTGAVLSQTALSGVGTGGLGVFEPGAEAVLVPNANTPRAPVVDALGNVYYSDQGTGRVMKIAAASVQGIESGTVQAGSVQPTVLASNVSGLAGLTVDGFGNVYYASNGDGAVYELVNGAGNPVLVANNLNPDNILLVDGSGNVYVTRESGAIQEIAAVNHTVTTLFGGYGDRLIGMAIDAQNNLFAATFSGNTLYEFPVGNYANPVKLYSGAPLNNPHGLAVDPSGNLYVTNYSGPARIMRFSAGTYTPTTLAGTGSAGIALDGSGNLYTVTESQVSVYSRTIAGLTFGSAAVGTTSSDSPQSVGFENDGNAALNVSSIAVASSNFKVVANNTTCITGAFAPAGTCAVGVSFTPQTAGSLSSALNLADDNQGAAGTVQAVALAGTGVAGTATIAVANNSVVYGGSTTTLSATLTYPGSTVPSGAFTFGVGSATPVAAICSGSASPLTCTATFPVSRLAAGTYTITGSLAGDANVNATAGTGTLLVTQAVPTLMVLNSSASLSSATTTLTASLAYSGSAPTGAVTFQVGTGAVMAAICTGSASPLTCTASYPLTSTAVGANTITANIAADTNYAAASATGTLTVTAATATITPVAATLVYGTGSTTLSASIAYTGNTAPTGPLSFAVGSRAPVTATCSGTASPLTCTATYVTSNLVPNTYTITTSLPADARFAATSGTATLTITPAAPSVAVTNSSISYGTTTAVLSAAVSFPGIVPSGAVVFTVDSGSAVTATCTGSVSPVSCTGTYPTAQLAPQSHTIKVAVLADTNYSAASGTGTLTVTPTTPVFAVASQSISFGTATANLSATLSYTGATPTGAVTFAIDGGSAVVASCTGSASPRTCTASYPSATLATAAHIIAVNLAADANYPAASGTGTLTVTPGSPVISVANTTIAYGAASAALSATISFAGKVPTGAVSFVVDNGAAVAGTCSGTSSPETCTAAYPSASLSTQSHPVKVGLAADGNYSAATGAGTLVVSAATPVITVAAQSGSFGVASTSITAVIAYSGAAAPTGAVVMAVDGGSTVLATCAGTASPLTCTASYPTSTLGAGPHTISVNSAADVNYKAATASGTLTLAVTSATIAFSVPNHSYGDAAFAVAATSNATGSFTYSVVSGPATVSGSTVTINGVGTVVLQASQAADANFSAGSKQTSFAVVQAPLAVSASSSTRVYGSANPAFTGAVTGAKYSDTFSETFASTATATSPTGTYAIVPTVSGTDLGDYTTTISNGTLTITQAPTVASLAASAASLNPGQNLTLTATVASTTTGTPTGSVTFLDGSTTLGTVALTNGTAVFNSASLTPGVAHSITVRYAGDTNFLASATALGTSVTVGQLDFTFNLTSATAYTAAPGSAGTFAFSLAPNFGSYAGAVNFTVTGLPVGATFSFSPSTVSASGGSVPVVLTVQTPKAVAINASPVNPVERGLPLMALLLLPGLGSRRLRRKLGSRALMAILVLAGIGGAGLLTGCGSNSNGFVIQPASTYTLTVTATSGSLQHSQTVTLTVQ